MLLTKTAQYALSAALVLAEIKYSKLASLVRVDEIALWTGAPSQYLSKVLRVLTKAGLVQSQRGPTGGYELADAPEQVTVLDILQAVEPLSRLITSKDAHHADPGAEHLPLGNGAKRGRVVGGGDHEAEPLMDVDHAHRLRINLCLERTVGMMEDQLASITLADLLR